MLGRGIQQFTGGDEVVNLPVSWVDMFLIEP